MADTQLSFSGRIFLGADHGGFYLKQEIKKWLKSLNFEVIDCGASVFDPDDDYPVFALKVAREVADQERLDQEQAVKDNALGILLCRSGGGMIIAANKVDGIRAVETHDPTSARHAREHNNANIIALSGDWLELDQIKEIILAALSTSWSNEERHLRRLDLIKQTE